MSHSGYRYELSIENVDFVLWKSVLTDFFLDSFCNFHVVPLHLQLMAIVAVIIAKVHNVTH